jgi:hypothetical protein
MALLHRCLPFPSGEREGIEHLETLQFLSPESLDQNLALAVLHVPLSLDSGEVALASVLSLTGYITIEFSLRHSVQG